MSYNQCTIFFYQNCWHCKVGRYPVNTLLIRNIVLALSFACILPPISRLHQPHPGHCSDSQHWVQIMLTSYPLFHVYIVVIVDIAMLADVDFKSLFLNLVYIVHIITTQCCPTSRRHCVYTYPLFLVNTVDIVNIAQWIGIYSTLCPHRTSFFLFIVFTHRWPRSVDQHRVEIMSTSLSFFLFYIFVIAILIGIEYTLCLHRTTILIYIGSTSCLQFVYIVPLFWCLHRPHLRHWVDIVCLLSC